MCIYLFFVQTISFVRLSAKESWFSSQCNLRNFQRAMDFRHDLARFWSINNVLMNQLHCHYSSAARKALASYSPLYVHRFKEEETDD